MVQSEIHSITFRLNIALNLESLDIVKNNFLLEPGVKFM